MSKTTDNKNTPLPDTLRAPMWLTILKIISYGLLFGVGSIVLTICAYVLFILDPSETEPGSMNRNIPLAEKLSALLTIVGIMVMGYFVNRYVWRGMIIKYGRSDT